MADQFERRGNALTSWRDFPSRHDATGSLPRVVRGDAPLQAMFCGSTVRMVEALRALEASGMGNRVTVLRTEYPNRDLSMIDVLNAGCSKGHALERWSVHRGYRREQVMAIGDNHNDVEMLEFAGYPVIMGNACEELRGRGWSVTLGNDRCGVAAAVADVVGR